MIMCPNTSIATPPPYTVPESTVIVNCLIMLAHNHEVEDGSHFFSVSSSIFGFFDPGVEKIVPFKRGTAFFFNALDVHRGPRIPKASPTGVAHPRLKAFFAIELTQGPDVRFPNLNATQAIKQPQVCMGPLEAKAYQGAVRCRGKVVAKCYGCDKSGIYGDYKDGLCVPCHDGEEPQEEN